MADAGFAELHEMRSRVMTPLGVVAQKWRTAAPGHTEHFIGWYLGQSPITEERAHQLISEGRPLSGPPGRSGTTAAGADGDQPSEVGRGALTVGELREILEGLPAELVVAIEIPGQRSGAPPEVDLSTVWIDRDHRRVHLTYRRDEGSGRPGTGE